MTSVETDSPPRRLRPVPRPRKALNALTSAAQRITGLGRSSLQPKAVSAAWQADAWQMYDSVGEQRFLANTLAGRMAQARFYVSEKSDDRTETSPPTEREDVQAILDAFGSDAVGRAQLITRIGINMFVAGEGWFVGIPSRFLESNEDDERDGPSPGSDEAIAPIGVPQDAGGEVVDLSDLDWRLVSTEEIKFNSGNEVEIKLPEKTVKADARELFVIRAWRPHPARAWEADSPVRSSLPVLRELVGLTMHISAQIDSRLAGAGVFLVPSEARDAILSRGSPDPPENEDDDPFTQILIEAMLSPIEDRSNASALVPLVLTVPGETVDNFKHISFASPLDPQAQELRDEAVRRLALGEDAPPEILLGTGGMNHWGAWLVREDTVTTHIEPPLALICDALTREYLWPILRQQGMSEEETRRFAVAYDIDHLIMRPNRTQDAFEAYDRGELSGDTLRDAAGFGDSDAPPETEDTDQAVTVALDMVKAAPSLAQNPGLAALVAELRAILNGDAAGATDETIAPVNDIDDTDDTGTDVIPDEDDTAGSPDETTGPAEISASSINIREANDYANWRSRFSDPEEGEADAGTAVLDHSER